MYEKYLTMNSVPAGKILETILRKRHLTQKQLAQMSHEYPQRISDYISGKRAFTIKSSIEIERALGIELEGFFVKLQTNHEVYCYIIGQELLVHPDLSRYSKALFWDTRMEKINWIRNKAWVIKRVFEYGNGEEIEETIRFYGKKVVKGVLSQLSSYQNTGNFAANYQKYMAL